MSTAGYHTLRRDPPTGLSSKSNHHLVGGTCLLKGKVEFTRFTRDCEVDRRVFSYNINADSTSYNNPILMAIDIFHSCDSTTWQA